jgi:hypothetical protein
MSAIDTAAEFRVILAKAVFRDLPDGFIALLTVVEFALAPMPLKPEPSHLSRPSFM